MNDPSSKPLGPPALPRRGFLKAAAAGLSLLVSAVLIWPLVASVVGSAYRRQQRRFRMVAKLDALPQGQPVRVSFPYESEEAFIRERQTRDVWVIKGPAGDVKVFSPICTHLSCRYDWNPQSRQFLCPCHGSVFGPDGQVLAGPAPRPLDTLPWKIEDGQLLVQWEIFASGVAQKVSV